MHGFVQKEKMYEYQTCKGMPKSSILSSHIKFTIFGHIDYLSYIISSPNLPFSRVTRLDKYRSRLDVFFEIINSFISKAQNGIVRTP